MRRPLLLAFAVVSLPVVWLAQTAHKPTPAAERRESTYTITSVMQFARPFRPADMTDDYQDARVVAQDANSVTMEIVYYPLNTNSKGIGENPNWRREHAGMTEYLGPTPTENWNPQMRADLIAALRADGIDPDHLTDRQLVTPVSRWLMQRSRTTKAFAIWYVHYPQGVPQVFPALRAAFDREKPSADVTDQTMFDQEVLGRQMFNNRVHGTCTSSVLIATVFRALGIPMRIVFCVPPADGNDPRQTAMLLNALHHHRVRATIRHDLPAGGGGSFANRREPERRALGRNLGHAHRDLSQDWAGAVVHQSVPSDTGLRSLRREEPHRQS